MYYHIVYDFVYIHKYLIDHNSRTVQLSCGDYKNYIRLYNGRVELSYLHTTDILTWTSGELSVNLIVTLFFNHMHKQSITNTSSPENIISGSYYPDVLCLVVISHTAGDHKNTAIQCSTCNALFKSQIIRVKDCWG